MYRSTGAFALTTRFIRPALAAILLLAAQASAANEADLSDRASFEAQKAKIHAQMIKGGEYGEISAEDRADVLRRLESIELALGLGDGTAGGLPPDRQLDIFNHQSAINQILTRAEADSRVVCTRERKTGSKFPVNRCVTVAEARREREDARDWSKTLNRTMRPEGQP
jgi:hypothetical protein